MNNPKHHNHFHGPIQGVVIGDNNTVTLVFEGGKEDIIPFLAPPKPPFELVGRESMIRDLKALMFGGEGLALYALNGLPGVGKSALCISLANDKETIEHFQDGVLWAGLGRDPNVMALLGRWGMALGIPETEFSKLTKIESRVDKIHEVIGLRRMLLVVDDAWQIEAALAFRLGGPNCSHIVTTRFPEIALQFAGNANQMVHELSEVDGLILLQQLAPKVIESELSEAKKLVGSVGGLPLALILIGNYLRIKSLQGEPTKIRLELEKLKRAQERLQLAEPQAPVQRHPSLPTGARISLEAIIGISYDALDQKSRFALRALSLFPPKPNTFSEEAALALLSDASNSSLDNLFDYGLMEISSPKRYSLHQTISDYANIRLSDDFIYERFVHFFDDYIGYQKKNYVVLDLETRNLFVALEFAFDRNFGQPFVRIVNNLYDYLSARGLYLTAESYLSKAIKVTRSVQDDSGLAAALNNFGRLAANQGDYGQAESLYKESLTLIRQSNSQENLVSVLANLGTLSLNRADYQNAKSYYEEGLLIAHRIEDGAQIGAIMMGLGAVMDSLSEYKEAEEYYLEALKITREVDQAERMCVILSNLGGLACVQGNYEHAETYFLEGLELARHIGHKENICLLLTGVGELEHLRKKYEKAEKYYKEGIIIAREIGHLKRLGVLLANLGALESELGDYIRSEEDLLEGLSLFRQLGLKWFVSSTLIQLGELHISQQKWDVAFSNLTDGLGFARELGVHDFEAGALFGLSKVALAKENIESAKRLGKESLTLYESIGHNKAIEVKNWLSGLP